MAKSKVAKRLNFIAMVVIVVFVIGLLLNLPHWNTIDHITGPTKFLLTEHSQYYEKVLFISMAREMDRFPQILTAEVINKEGLVSILHGTMIEVTSSLFDTFVANSSGGKVAQVILAVYTTEGYPIYKNVLFDRVQYIAVIDHSHDRYKAEDEDKEYLRYDYLKIFTNPETESKFVVLTNEAGLTFEKLRDAQIGSNMESIDAYQLFSYSE